MDAVTIKAQAHAWEFLFSVNIDDLPAATCERVEEAARLAETPKTKLKFTFTQAEAWAIIKHAIMGMDVCADDVTIAHLCRPVAKLYANACEALTAAMETQGNLTHGHATGGFADVD